MPSLVWLGRNIAYFQSELNATIVKQSFLNANEVKDISWSSVNLTFAGWYQNINFTVQLDGATVTAHVTLDMDSGETTAQIATKLEKSPIKLNYNYWNGKNLADNLPELRSILVNEGILTTVEASEIQGLTNPTQDPNFYNVNSEWANPGFKHIINYKINDHKTTSGTANYAGVVTLNDGKSAQQIADEIVSTDTYFISKNDQGLFADSKGPATDIKTQAVKWDISATQAQYMQIPHIILQAQNYNVVYHFEKDGQIAATTPSTITANQ